jgi:hypothetical protein
MIERKEPQRRHGLYCRVTEYLQPPSWVLDELAHAGEEHLDPAYVAAYDRKQQTDPGDDLARLCGLGLDSTATLVDFGAGTGTFTLAAAAVCRRVVAEVIESWLARAPRQSEEGYTAADLATHVRTEYSTYTWLLEPMLERAGFEVRDAEYPSPVFAAYTSIKR